MSFASVPLLLSLLAPAAAKDLLSKMHGHWGEGMTSAAAACNYTYQVAQVVTCGQVATANSMSLKAFIDLNAKVPGFNCTGNTNTLSPPIVVCVSSSVYQDDSGNAYNGTTGKSIPLPAAGSSNTPSFTKITTTTLRAAASASVTSSGSTAAEAASVSATTDAASVDADPAVSASAAAAAASASAAAAAAAAEASAEAAAEAAASASAAASLAAAQTPCNQIDGTLVPCEAYAATDSPPDYSGYDIETQCLALTQYARQHYNYGANYLNWDPVLAAYAQYSANYAAYYNCGECHTYSGSGYSWGQNLFLGEYDCQSGYFGWVTNEAAGNDPSNPDEGHFQNIVGFADPYVGIGCASASQNGNTAVVCNFGLVTLDPSTSVPTF
ncbi:hypothetical protein HDU82_000089 [Entophlyctis luteolus]|nr:hypothetical protein HDU82_000089 [Entophlyctis luteolus]